MKDKIVRFPSALANRRVERITAYQPSSRAETLIAVWLCSWAMLTAAECVRQQSAGSSGAVSSTGRRSNLCGGNAPN